MLPVSPCRTAALPRVAIALAACGLALFLKAGPDVQPTVWKLVDPAVAGGHKTEVLGAPKVIQEGEAKALCFNGESDGLLVPVNPIEGWSRFTIEILFKPDGTGPEEQRFLHIQDERGERALIETRVTKDRQWALDTYLHIDMEHRLTLLDRTKLHPTDRWYWVALSYDGKTMRHYINGEKELEGEVAIPAMMKGGISLGVRQNKVFWFKGCIREVRFTSAALDAASLQRVEK